MCAFMMKSFLYIVILILLLSCKPYQYVAPQHYTPLSDEEGVVTVNIGPNNIQTGYTFSDRFGVFLTANYRSFDNTFTILDDDGKENSWIVNPGVYFFKTNNHFSCEVLLGSGIGYINYINKIDYQEQDYIFNLKSNKLNFYIQPNIGYKSNFIEIGAFTKLNYYNYFNIRTFYQYGTNYHDYFIYSIEDKDAYFFERNNASLLFAEPGVFVKIGDENVKFCGEFSYTTNLLNNNTNHRSVNIYFSLYIKLFSLF